MKAALIAFSARGMCVGERVVGVLERAGIETELDRCSSGALSKWTKAHFTDDTLIFIGSCGIAVRAVAPFVQSKMTDPAVIVIDERGAYVISLLSGHVGGANGIALAIARQVGAIPVLTTATDINGVFAFDAWAARQNLAIADPGLIKHISARMLARDRINVKSDFPVAGRPPQGVALCSERPDVLISRRAGAGAADVLTLVPRIVTLGIGAKKGAGCGDIECAFEWILSEADCHPLAVKQVCSVDLKAEEQGILEFCRRRGLAYNTFSAGRLAELPGAYTASEFVRSVVGIDNVCERSAMLGSGKNGRLLAKKNAGRGITMALAIEPYTVCFEEEAADE
jgi:cobalt-precorrin 5A hydrolase